MTFIESEFDQAFKSRGGIYRGRLFTIDLFAVAIKHARFYIESITRNKGHFPKAHMDIIDTALIGACATKRGSNYFIGVNAGTLLFIRDVFYRMMSSKHIFPEIGDITKEADTRRLFNVQLNDYTQLHLQTEPGEILHPVDKVRALLAQTFVEIVLEFIVFHEYAHILFGHVDYYKSVLGVFEIDEIRQDANAGNEIDPLISQTLEMDADSFATTRGLELLYSIHNNRDFLVPELSEFYDNWSIMLSVWVFAIYTFFRIFGPKNSLEKMKTGSHPPPSIRAHLNMVAIYPNFEQKYDKSLINDLPTIFSNAILQVEQAFAEISEQGFDPSAYNFSRSKAASDHCLFLMKNWNNVRPLLEPFAYNTLAPLYVD